MATVNVRRSWLWCAGIAVITLIVLGISGARGLMVREFSNRIPDQASVALLRPTQQVCEGPVTSPRQTQGVGIWGGSVIGSARLTVTVQDAVTRQELAVGRIGATAPTEYIARLDHTVPGGRPLRICLVGSLNTFSLLGGPAASRSAAMTGRKPGAEFSLALLNDDRSLLGSLSTAFSRASLFRPAWVGSWTFWLLACALLAAFGLGVAAVTSAASADGDEDGRGDGRGDDPDGEDVPPPSPDPRSEAGQDRPQTVP
jgi:hypothetical protein